MSIVEEAFALLVAQEAAGQESVSEVVASDTYLGLSLASGASGWALCYSDLDRLGRQERVSELVVASRDPLLIDSLFETDNDKPADLIVEALRVALVSALAEPLWRQPEMFGFKSFAGVPTSLFGEPETALIVGFGGLMFQVATCPSLRRLVVADLTLPQRRRRMEAVADILRLLNPNLICELTDGKDMGLTAADADLLSISGSALSNGTMAELLNLPTPPGAVVVVQGQSAAIHPTPLFRRGASIVVSCTKPYEMLEAARDPSPRSLNRFTESLCQWISLVQST